MRSRSTEQAPASHSYSSISTERIMSAVERQRRISQQLEHLESQQQAQLARVRRAGPKIIGAIFLLIGVAILGLLGLFLFEPDLFLDVLAFSNGAIDVVMQVGRYLSTWLAISAGQSWLLAGTALIIVIIAGVWLHLMRAPEEA